MGVRAWRVYLLAAALLFPVVAFAANDQTEYAVKGKFFDAADQPTYRIAPDGGADWYTITGSRAYHENCQNCHGPKGLGSIFGTALTVAVAKIRYFDFVDATVNGQIVQTSDQARIMPAFGTNLEVTCRLDAIYVYLRAEAAGVLTNSDKIALASDGKAPEAELAECLRE